MMAIWVEKQDESTGLIACTTPKLSDWLSSSEVLNDRVNPMIERHQQRHVAGNDLRQHPRGGADLPGSALIGQ